MSDDKLENPPKPKPPNKVKEKFPPNKPVKEFPADIPRQEERPPGNIKKGINNKD